MSPDVHRCPRSCLFGAKDVLLLFESDNKQILYNWMDVIEICEFFSGFRKKGNGLERELSGRALTGVANKQEMNTYEKAEG